MSMQQTYWWGVGTALVDASGGRKTEGRNLLLDWLKTHTEIETAKAIKVSAAFISLVASGKKIPYGWRIRTAFAAVCQIPPESWEKRV